MRLIQTIILTITLGAFLAPSVLFAQKSDNDSSKIKMNRISIQTGLFHYFFDGTPILNINYLYSESSIDSPFRGLFFGSFGLQYDRKINKKNSLSIEVMSFWNSYLRNVEEFPETGSSTNHPDEVDLTPRVFKRTFTTVNINYSRILNLCNTVNFVYGGGINYRHGSESIIVAKNSFEINLVGTRKNDFGLNTFAGIDYTPWRWLTVYTRLDFMALLYLDDKEGIEELRNINTMPKHYPSRFDLSLRFGVGVNF